MDLYKLIVYVELETIMDEKIRNKTINEFALFLFDLNDLKIMNDTYGHEIGDKYIIKSCQIIKSLFPHTDVYRYGGDEYLIVLPEIAEETFLEKIKIARDCTNGALHFSGGYTKGYVSSSKDLHTLINKADENLYKAKKAGKNKVLGSF